MTGMLYVHVDSRCEAERSNPSSSVKTNWPIAIMNPYYYYMAEYKN